MSNSRRARTFRRLQRGERKLEEMSDRELLALLINSEKGAEELLEMCDGDLAHVFDLNPQYLSAVTGVDSGNAFLLAGYREIFVRAFNSRYAQL